MVKQLYLSLWLMDAEELQKLSLLFVFQRGDQGATQSAGGGRGSRGPALRGAATAGGELHHPLRYGVSLETSAATKRCIKIDAYNKLPWSFAPTYKVFSSICLKLIIAHYIKFCVCSRHVPLMFGNQKLSKCSYIFCLVIFYANAWYFIIYYNVISGLRVQIILCTP